MGLATTEHPDILFEALKNPEHPSSLVKPERYHFDREDPPDQIKWSRYRITGGIECPCCFYQDFVEGRKKPDGIHPSINVAYDQAIKDLFDQARYNEGKEEELSPAQKKVQDIIALTGRHLVPFRHPKMNAWRDALSAGIQYEVTINGQKILLKGAPDDIWQDPETGELFIVDYKATFTNSGHTIPDYHQRQLEFYQYLLRQQGFEVSNTAFLLYSNARPYDQANDVIDEEIDPEQWVMKSDFTVLETEGKADWIEPEVIKLVEAVQSGKRPEPADDCQSCEDKRLVVCDELAQEIRETAEFRDTPEFVRAEVNAQIRNLVYLSYQQACRETEGVRKRREQVIKQVRNSIKILKTIRSFAKKLSKEFEDPQEIDRTLGKILTPKERNGSAKGITTIATRMAERAASLLLESGKEATDKELEKNLAGLKKLTALHAWAWYTYSRAAGVKDIYENRLREFIWTMVNQVFAKKRNKTSTKDLEDAYMQQHSTWRTRHTAVGAGKKLIKDMSAPRRTADNRRSPDVKLGLGTWEKGPIYDQAEEDALTGPMTENQMEFVPSEVAKVKARILETLIPKGIQLILSRKREKRPKSPHIAHVIRNAELIRTEVEQQMSNKNFHRYHVEQALEASIDFHLATAEQIWRFTQIAIYTAYDEIKGLTQAQKLSLRRFFEVSILNSFATYPEAFDDLPDDFDSIPEDVSFIYGKAFTEWHSQKKQTKE